MKLPVQAVLKLSSMSPTEKTTKADYVAQQWALHGKDFPATAPNTPEERAQATLRLSKAHAAASDGGKQAKAEEKAALAEFDRLFGAYRDWANQPDVAQGDEIRIGRLGLDTSHAEARRAEDLGAPTLRPLTGTTEGALTAACVSLPEAKAYVWFVAYGEDVPLDSDYRYCDGSTRPKVTLTLEPGKMVWVRVLAIGTRGPSPFSTPQKRRVL